MATYYDTGPIPWAPALKVKPLSRYWDASFDRWMVECRITSRMQTEYSGHKCGAIRHCYPSSLYEHQGVRRGTFGKLYWQGQMTYKALMALPVSAAE